MLTLVRMSRASSGPVTSPSNASFSCLSLATCSSYAFLMLVNMSTLCFEAVSVAFRSRMASASLSLRRRTCSSSGAARPRSTWRLTCISDTRRPFSVSNCAMTPFCRCTARFCKSHSSTSRRLSFTTDRYFWRDTLASGSVPRGAVVPFTSSCSFSNSCLRFSFSSLVLLLTSFSISAICLLAKACPHATSSWDGSSAQGPGPQLLRSSISTCAAWSSWAKSAFLCLSIASSCWCNLALSSDSWMSV
mmetsp:Transcript_147203/g.257117  ORF Transcript_147203/g.257117 Transcript_147203/m.257117 type:complete len:247 (-) Transcript_147203:3220-3960(-)